MFFSNNFSRFLSAPVPSSWSDLNTASQVPCSFLNLVSVQSKKFGWSFVNFYCVLAAYTTFDKVFEMDMVIHLTSLIPTQNVVNSHKEYLHHVLTLRYHLDRFCQYWRACFNVPSTAECSMCPFCTSWSIFQIKTSWRRQHFHL